MDSYKKPDIKENKWLNVNYVDQSTLKGDLTQFRDREVPINFGFLLKSDPFTFVHTMTEIALENSELKKKISFLETENENLRRIFTSQNLQASLNKEEKLETEAEAPPKLSDDLIDLTFSCDESCTNNNSKIVVSNNNDNDNDEAEEVIEIKNPVNTKGNGNGASHNFTIRVELVNKTSESRSHQSPQNQHQSQLNRQFTSKGCQCKTRTRQKRRSSNNISTENNEHQSSTRRQMIPLPYNMAILNNPNHNPSRNISSNSLGSSKSNDKGQSQNQNKKPPNACVFAMKIDDISPTPSAVKKNKKKSKSRFCKNAFNAFLGRNNNAIPERTGGNTTSKTNYESNNRISFPINSSIPTSTQNIKPRPSIYQPQSQPLKSQFSSHRRPPAPPIQFRDDTDSYDDLLN